MAMSDYDDTLRANVDELIAWARSRIAECRRQELKFPPVSQASPEAIIVSQTSFEAIAERRALQAVLRMLAVKEGGDGES